MLHILGISAIYSFFLLSGGGQILTIIFLKELPKLFFWITLTHKSLHALGGVPKYEVMLEWNM